jgi:hypothetical protein
MTDWSGNIIPIARSKGGVKDTKAVAHPCDNLIRTDIASWPPPEIVQKFYKSRQSKAFGGKDLEIATSVIASQENSGKSKKYRILWSG